MRADLPLPPGAEPDGEALGDRFAQRPRLGRFARAVEIDVRVEARDLRDPPQAAVLSRKAVSRSTQGLKLGRPRIAST